MVNLFCSRCFNYVDFCDCINYDYDLEDYTDRKIPPPPEEAGPPEVGTTWYFRIPIANLSQYLSERGIQNVGLDALLSIKGLWTLYPPDNPELYLSIPVDRLTLATPPFGSKKQFDMYTQPWDMNYFNFSTGIKQLAKTIAQKIMDCQRIKSKIGRKWCRAKAVLSEFIPNIKMEDPPIPAGLELEFAQMPLGGIDPDLAIAALTMYIPQNQLEELNDMFVPAIDYVWVNQHLIDQKDPPVGFEDYYKYNFFDCLKDFRNCLNNTIDVPTDTNEFATDQLPQANPSSLPSLDDLAKPRKIFWMSDKNGRFIALNQNRDPKNPKKILGPPFPPGVNNTPYPWAGKRPRTIASLNPIKGPPSSNPIQLVPLPLNPSVIPYSGDDDMDDDVIKGPNNPPTDSLVPFASLPFSTTSQPYTIPTAIMVLFRQGSNLTQYIGTPSLTSEVQNDGTVKTIMRTQGTVDNYRNRITMVACLPSGVSVGSTVTRTFNFTRLNGSTPGVNYDPQLLMEALPGGTQTTYTEDGSGVIAATISFISTTTAAHFAYRHVLIRGVLGTDLPNPGNVPINTWWEIKCTGLCPTNVRATLYSAKSTLWAPPMNGVWGGSDGETLLEQSFDDTTTAHVSKSITVNPATMVPMGISVLNEVNMLATSPNSSVSPAAVGYVMGLGGGVGGAGAHYLPFDPVGVTTNVTYNFSIKKSQGQTRVRGLIRYFPI